MASEPQDFADVQFSANSLWNRRSWIILGALLGMILALLFVFTQPQTNRSWSQVLIRPLGVDLTRGAVNIDRAIDHLAERELAQSFIVAERTAGRIDSDIAPRELRRNVGVEAVNDSPVLEFTYADGDAELARDIAQSFAESYLEIRAEFAAETVAQSRDALEQRQADLIGERDQLLRVRSALRDDDDLVANISAESVVTNQIATISNDIALLGALTSDPGEIISPAQLAQRSERPRTMPMLLAGLLLGALLGVMAALFFDRDQRERDLSDEDLDKLGLRPIAHLPRGSRGADAVKGLERSIADSMGDEYVLAFTTVDDAAVSTQVGPWYAWNLAENGARVLLISADFEKKSIARQFGLTGNAGLLDALVGGTDPEEVAQQVGALNVVTAGDHPSEPLSVLQMVGMTRFLNRARRVYDVVVLHAPDVTSREASLLALWAVDGVAIVTDGQPRAEIERAAERLGRTDARVLGAVALTELSD